MDFMPNSTSFIRTTVLPALEVSEGFIIVLFNLLTLSIFLRKTFRIKMSNYLLISLTAADLVVGSTLLVLKIPYRFAGLQEDAVSSICIVLNSASIAASQYSFTVIALERVYSILFPFKHRLLQSRHYTLGITVTWTLAALGDIPMLMRQIGRPFHDYLDKLLFGIKMILSIVSLVITLVCYLAIWIKVKSTKPLPSARPARSNIKLTLTLFVVTVVSFICFLPSAILYFYIVWNDPSFNRFYPYIFPFLYMNSCVNFVIYSSRMPEFRRELYKMVTKCGPVCACAILRQADSCHLATSPEIKGQPTLIMMNSFANLSGELDVQLQEKQDESKLTRLQ